MAYDLVGCMKKGDGDKWQPVWIDPCDGVTEMPGCMIKSAEKWAPKLEGGFGICTDDKTGCMRLAGGAHKPILIYDEYDSEDELFNDCCVGGGCDVCWEGRAPRYIDITFSGISWCPDEPRPEGWSSPNQTFTLEWNQDYVNCMLSVFGGIYTSACVWVHPRLAMGFSIVCLLLTFEGKNYIMLGMNSNSGITGCTGTGHSFSITVFDNPVAGAYPEFSCLDTNYTNWRTVDSCSGIINDAYGGNAVINWDP